MEFGINISHANEETTIKLRGSSAEIVQDLGRLEGQVVLVFPSLKKLDEGLTKEEIIKRVPVYVGKKLPNYLVAVCEGFQKTQSDFHFGVFEGSLNVLIGWAKNQYENIPQSILEYHHRIANLN